MGSVKGAGRYRVLWFMSGVCDLFGTISCALELGRDLGGTWEELGVCPPTLKVERNLYTNTNLPNSW
jgi:hypothetical protein